jgi:hypothetical protein
LQQALAEAVAPLLPSPLEISTDEPLATRPSRSSRPLGLAATAVLFSAALGCWLAASRGRSPAPAAQAPAVAQAPAPPAIPVRENEANGEVPSPPPAAEPEVTASVPAADPVPVPEPAPAPAPPSPGETSPQTRSLVFKPARFGPSLEAPSRPGPSPASGAVEPPPTAPEPTAPASFLLAGDRDEAATAPASQHLGDGGEPKRVRIRIESGETVVGQVYGAVDGRTCVLLPDGQLGFTRGMAETDEPFRPATHEKLRAQLTDGGPFARFQAKQSAHYLVLYQSTPAFAEASIKLLENLYKNLSEALRKRNFPVHDAPFPLVAIIFRTEKDFRAHKQVDPDVQAYYEILSNRIYFYQTSDRDQQSPEVAALRKPQTVAHEGTHQILQNIGIHPRLGDWPIWLVEGLAEYCSPPTMTRRGAAWGGMGLVNPMHMATIRDLDDPASQFVQGMSRPQLGRDRRRPLVEHLVTRTALTPTDYALSWALTHYLAMRKGTAFIAFLKTMSEIPPLVKRSPEEQLASFRAAFGSDLVKLDKAIAIYLAKLKYDPLPYYAVMFQQAVGGGRVNRATLVSQSPSVIQQWLEQVRRPDGAPPACEIIPHPTKARALLTTQQWIHSQ